MRARKKMPLFVGITVYCILQKICPHSQVIKEGAALCRSPVASKVFTILFRLEEKCKAPPFGRFDLLSKGQICLHTSQPCCLLTSQDIGHPRVNRARRVLAMPYVDTQGTAVSGHLFDVEEREAMGSKDGAHRVQGKV